MKLLIVVCLVLLAGVMISEAEPIKQGTVLTLVPEKHGARPKVGAQLVGGNKALKPGSNAHLSEASLKTLAG